MKLPRLFLLPFFGLIQLSLVAEIIEDSNGIKYETTGDETCLIYYNAGYEGNKDVRIPYSVNDYVVAGLVPVKDGKGPFAGTGIESLDLSDCKGITSIPQGTFSNQKELTNITLPSTISNIGDNAFLGSVNLTEIDLSGCSELNTINNTTFKNCTSLKRVILPTGIIEIEGSAFEGDINLEKINITDCRTLIKILDNAFKDCEKLPSLDLSELKSLELVSSNAFENCRSFEWIILPENLKVFDLNALQGCENLKYVACYSVEPPECANPLTSPDPKNIDLYSPNHPLYFGESKYTAVHGWQDFGNFLSIEDLPRNGDSSDNQGDGEDEGDNDDNDNGDDGDDTEFPGEDPNEEPDDPQPDPDPEPEEPDTEPDEPEPVPDPEPDNPVDDPDPVIPVVSVTLSPTSISLYETQIENLKVNYTPSEAEPKIVWTIEDDSIAAVNLSAFSETVTVRALNPGKTFIAVTAITGTDSLNAVAPITVTAIPVNSINLNYNELTLDMKDHGVLLKAEVSSPLNLVPSLKWMSSNENIAYVTVLDSISAQITPVIYGSCDITVSVKSNAQMKAECKINISDLTGLENLNEKSNEELPFDVYDINGRLLRHRVNKDDLKTLSKGVYIIRQGAISTKVKVE